MAFVDNWVVGKEEVCYWLSNDIVGLVGGEGALEVLEEGLAVGEGDGGDADGEGVLDVLGVLEVVVLYVVD